MTISKWKELYEWDKKADNLDHEVAKAVNAKYIQEKTRMMTRHADVGRELQDMGLNYLREHPISSQTTALKAILSGMQVEQDSTQIEKLLKEIASLSDDRLMDELQGLLGETTYHESAEDS